MAKPPVTFRDKAGDSANAVSMSSLDRGPFANVQE